MEYIKQLHRRMGSTGSHADALTARILWDQNIRKLQNFYDAFNKPPTMDELLVQAAKILGYRKKYGDLPKGKQDSCVDLVGETLDKQGKPKEICPDELRVKLNLKLPHGWKGDQKESDNKIGVKFAAAFQWNGKEWLVKKTQGGISCDFVSDPAEATLFDTFHAALRYGLFVEEQAYYGGAEGFSRRKKAEVIFVETKEKGKKQ